MDIDGSTLEGTRLRSYGSIYGLGHPAIGELFDGPVVVEEKIDGSQFSFGIVNGQLLCRSKGVEIPTGTTVGMFDRAIAFAVNAESKLTPGWIYRCEYLRSRKHNTLAYDRHPAEHLIVLDIETGLETFLSPADKKSASVCVGLECVPLFFEGVVASIDDLRPYIERESVLGGGKVEGVVIKNYARFGKDKHYLKGKIVRDDFKERHKVEWKQQNPGGDDIKARIAESLRVQARWEKGVQHLRDRGELTGTPKDIGPLIKEIGQDIFRECADEVKADLFKWAWGDISRMAIRGIPEWYKARLVETQPIPPLPPSGKEPPCE